MNDQMLNESLSSKQMMQMTAWLEWMQPFLYCLLALALVSLAIALLDLAMLCRKEFHSAKAQEITTATPVREATTTSVATLKQQRYDAVKVLFLLLCFSPFTFM